MNERFEYTGAAASGASSQTKVSWQQDPKIPYMATFRVEGEDHTVGNLLRMHLLRNPSVLFAGYKVPHPLEHHIVLKIQTDGQASPMDALKRAIEDIIAQLSVIEEKFEGEVRKTRGVTMR